MYISHFWQWSDLPKQWRATHMLDVCSAIYLSGFHTQTVTLESYSLPRSMFSHSCQWFWDSQTLEEQLTTWICIWHFSSVVLICSNAGEGLTFWMGVKPFSSVSRSAQTLERDSHTGWVFSHYISGSNLPSLKQLRATHILMVVQPFSSLILIYQYSKHWQWLTSLTDVQ